KAGGAHRSLYPRVGDKRMTEVMLRLEVSYAVPERQKVVEQCVDGGYTALQPARPACLVTTYHALYCAQIHREIFSQTLDGTVHARAADYVLEDGDRVEVYRPLLNDPKLARVRKAAQARKGSKKGW